MSKLLPEREKNISNHKTSSGQKIYEFWLCFALGSLIVAIGLILLRGEFFGGKIIDSGPRKRLIEEEGKPDEKDPKKPKSNEDKGLAPSIKTEEEYYREVRENPDRKKYLDFISRYSSSSRKNELEELVKSNDINLPSSDYWPDIEKNSNGYYEITHRNLIRLVWIPSREWVNHGSEKKGKIINRGFWIGKYEVSVKEYKIFCERNGKNAPNFLFRDDEPIRDVSWNEANQFCQWLGCRLPTEDEWELAARGGKNYINFPWGESFLPAKCNVNTKTLVDVKTWEPNGYGLFNVMGNVKEWCQDWYSGDSSTAQGNKIFKIFKGGSFRDIAEDVGIQRRDGIFSTYTRDTIGFRVAKD